MSCKKCGQDTLQPEYVAVDTTIRHSGLALDQERFTTTVPSVYKGLVFLVTAEHLVVTCRTCGCRYATECKDAT